MKKLKIAQLSTPFFPVPPENYGGTELVVSNITEELVKRGHEVTLFAPGDSKTSAKLLSLYKKSLDSEEMEKQFSPLAYQLFWLHSLPTLMQVVEPFEKAEQFDIIHNHQHYLGLFFAKFIKTPVLHTYHGDFAGAIKSPIEKMILEKYMDQNWTAISQSQKRDCEINLNFVSVIHHGVPIQRFIFNDSPQDYMVWLGRITPKKGLQYAIETALKTNHKLIIAGVIHPRDEEFFKKEIEPKIDNNLIKFYGGLNLDDKVKLLKDAKVLLYPVTWEEPFGLVMIEAMATGTPVVAFSEGAVPEIVKDLETGYLVEKQSIEGFIEKVENIFKMNEIQYKQLRQNSRKRVEDNFTVEKMVDKYEEVYSKILEANLIEK